MSTPMQPLTWLVVGITGWVQRDQQAAIVYLLEENRVLKARLRGRKLRLMDDERHRLAVKGKALGRKLLAEVVGIVTPETNRLPLCAVLALFAVGDVYVSRCKKALTLNLARGEGRERYFGCNLMQRKVLALRSYQIRTALAQRAVPLPVPSIYSSARPELDRSPVCRDHAYMISSFVRARPLARPQTQTLSY